ncbi:MAG: hypothetical protein JKZ03_01295 [Flavobacteriaceae bacterium]|nr:hypothetical protein [Flavobacteriaceae bacterium]
MDISARKYRFIEQVMKIVSEEKLEKLEKFFKKEIEPNSKDVWDELPEVAKQLVLKSKKQSADNRIIPHNDIMKKVRKNFKMSK